MTSPSDPAGVDGPQTTVAEALRTGMARGLPRLEAHMLLLHVLGRSQHDRAWLLSHDQDTLPAGCAAVYSGLVERRLAGEPVAYLLGHKDFHGVTLHVSADVLDPRDDTETLVDWALDCVAPLAAPRLLDLGTGSGAVALALARARPDSEVHAVEASPAALAVATANAHHLGLDVVFHPGDWFQALPAGLPLFDLVASNPPYIADGDEHLASLRHEPRQALVSGADGLDDIRRIVAGAGAHLVPGGWLLLEHGHDQADAVAELLSAAGFGSVQHRLDLAGIRRCTGGRWSAR